MRNDLSFIFDDELKVTVLNVNEGRNKELMESCKSLRDYSLFVGKVKYTQETKLKNSKDYFMSHKKELIEKAVIKAIDECITENILRDYFIQNRQEAIDMSTLECTAEIYYKAVTEDSHDNAVAETNNFYSWLFSNGRDNDAKKAASDKAYFDKLYKEYESAKSKKM